MRSTSVDYLNKIYANATYTKREKQRVGSVQKKMQKNQMRKETNPIILAFQIAQRNLLESD